MKPEANPEIGEQISSFQQQVLRARLNNEDVYIKHVVSDYSWWTFDESDIYQREIISHLLMSQLTRINVLQSSDPQKRQFVTHALTQLELSADNAQDFIHAILPLLQSMREVRATGLEELSFLALVDAYQEKSAQANVEPHFTQEICTQLRDWHNALGSDLCFVHGDLHPHNILLTKDGGLFPFDYEESIEGPPAFDAANIAWNIREHCGSAWHAYFENAYQSTFHEPLSGPDEWLRFCRLRRWIVSCYLTRCCDESTIKLASSFIVAQPDKRVEHQ